MQDLFYYEFCVSVEGQQSCYQIPVRFGRRKKSLALKTELGHTYIEVPRHLGKSEVKALLAENQLWLEKNYLKRQLSHSDQNLANAATKPTFYGQVPICSPFELPLHWQSDEPQQPPSVIEGQQRESQQRLLIGHCQLFGQGCALYWQSFMAASARQFTDHAANKWRLEFSQSAWNRLNKAILELPEEHLSVYDKNRLIDWALQTFVVPQWQAYWQTSEASVEDAQSELVFYSLCGRESDECFEAQFALEQIFLPSEAMQWVWHWAMSHFLGQVYQQTLQDHISAELPALAQRMQLVYHSFSVKSFKSRWGSCKTDRTLQFNWRILQAPSQAIEYLMIHELAHLKHPNHSPDYWALVEHYFPDVQTIKSLIKREGHHWIEFLSPVYR